MIIVVDFGSQTAHLIGRRIRELGAEVEILNPKDALSMVRRLKPKGIIFSGGPASVYEEDSPTIDPSIFSLGIPILGICYGLQLTARLLGGKVVSGKKEYGPAILKLKVQSAKFKFVEGLPKKITVWMSHGDEVVKLPQGFVVLGLTKDVKFAFVANNNKRIYGVQFHPEVIHTQFGEQILSNFLRICGVILRKQKIDRKLVQNIVQDIKDSIGNKKAICALSGGVDSSVAALLVHEAIGSNITAVYIDSGLMREGETELLEKVFNSHYRMKIKMVRAQDTFLNKLRGIVNPEKKREIIGNSFIEVLEHEAKKTGSEFLVQGTIYPDVIESAGTVHSQKIKTHHNVAGLPRDMKLALVEPLRTFYKDEVRQIGRILKLPAEIIERHPFPGPGLAIRIIGEVTQKKLDILRHADNIVQEEIRGAQLENKLWQVFAVLTGIKTTGVRGDNRVYGETIAIRAVVARDAMTARVAELPYSLLFKINSRIVNEVKQVNRVVYDITTKPPATIEWE